MAGVTPLATAISIVVLGDGFKPSMVDERELFNGRIDDGRTIVPDFSQIQYHSGLYELAVMQNRASMKSVGSDPLSPYFISNVERFFGILDGFKGVISVSAWGMNYEASFSLDKHGSEYCNDLVSKSRFNRLLQGDDSGRVDAWLKGTVGYKNLLMTVRIEPKIDSQGRDLFVAVNGHRNLDANGLLVPDMDESILQFREYVEAFHERIPGA